MPKRTSGPSDSPIAHSLSPSELLVADLNTCTVELCISLASSLNLTIRTALDSDAVLDALESGLVDVLLLSQQLPGSQELELLRHIHYWYPETQVIMVAEEPGYASAVQATKLGAFDYLPKPLERDELQHTIERAIEQFRMESARSGVRLTADTEKGYGIVGQNGAMSKVFTIIGKVAGNIHPVLVLGESGTGKELVSRAIHFTGPRRDRPFVPVDCGALVPTLMESELFGHEKGSFTGADQAKQGLLQIAEGGTIFFDEIGELPIELQAKLLRALQQKEIRRVGSTKSVRIDVRVIAATNKNLEEEVRTGKFRKDLYFRLNVVTIKLPPLRERVDDIKDLAETFLDRIANATGQPPKTLSEKALRILKTYHWPGNVRELENFIERAVALGSGSKLEPIDFPSHIDKDVVLPGLSSGQERMRRVRILSIAEVERHAILNAVAESNGDKLLAARMLGIGKTTLYRKLRQYNRVSQPTVEQETPSAPVP